MYSSPTEAQRAPGGWRTVHLVLAALIGFLVVLAVAATLMLQKAALQPSVRQLALPLLAVVELADAGDAGDPARAARALERQGIERAARPRPSVDKLPVPFLEVLVAYLRSESGRAAEIEKGAAGSVRIWLASARGDWIGIPLEPMRTLVARFALLVAALSLLLALLAAWWLARRLAAPVERLAAIAARLPEPVAADEFRVSGPREIQLLGDRLAQALGRIETQRRERDLMLAGLSHDLRTPLMRLLLRIDLLDGLPEAEREALHADIGELDRRIDRFIEHARTGAEEPYTQVDLVPLLRAEVAASVARGHPWAERLPERARVRGQPGVLARLIANLIDNAEQHGAAPFAAELAGDGGHWRLRIDNALRAPADESAVLPHRGFGLALCRHIAQSHGGRLEHGVVDGMHRVDLCLRGEDGSAPNSGREG
ncbi:MAG: HAMP domain-containing histidine kinase [Rhodanobacteraceae bacterium]|nr:HAMP domain-containing histidine kinase [Rhodanobacteraceae bacterium]